MPKFRNRSKTQQKFCNRNKSSFSHFFKLIQIDSVSNCFSSALGQKFRLENKTQFIRVKFISPIALEMARNTFNANEKQKVDTSDANQSKSWNQQQQVRNAVQIYVNENHTSISTYK